MKASDIVSALARRYGNNSSTTIAFEVAYGTGRHANRHVDALVMELWPSRGLSLHAMEIKVSRSDLLRELATPAKAEEIAQHCDYFSLVTPVGLVKGNIEIPKAWGLMEVKTDGVFILKKDAVKTKARPVDREFLAAFLRALGKSVGISAERARIAAEVRKSVYERFDAEVEHRLAQRAADGKKWKEFVELVGDLNWREDKILDAIRLIVRSDIDNFYGGARYLEKQLREAADKIKTASDNMHLKELPRK